MRALLALGFASAALVAGTMVAQRALDPNNWRERRHAIERHLAELEQKPCAPLLLKGLVEELTAAHDLAAAGAALDLSIARCELPLSMHKLAFELHMRLRQAGRAVDDAGRRLRIAEAHHDEVELISAYRDRARAHDALGEPQLATNDDLAVLYLSPGDEVAYARALQRYQSLGDKQGAQQVRMMRREAALAPALTAPPTP